MQALNHPKGNFLWENLSRGELSGVNYLRGKRPRANYPPGNNLGHLSRWQSSRGRFFSGAIVRRAGGGVAIFLGAIVQTPLIIRYQFILEKFS